MEGLLLLLAQAAGTFLLFKDTSWVGTVQVRSCSYSVRTYVELSFMSFRYECAKPTCVGGSFTNVDFQRMNFEAV